MNISEVKAKAKELGILISNKKKDNLIREIQLEEGNINCYGTHRVSCCNENNCLWRTDCQKEIKFELK